jgi:hypothetical protein
MAAALMAGIGSAAQALTIRFAVDPGTGIFGDLRTDPFGAASQMLTQATTPSQNITTDFAPGLNLATYVAESNRTTSPGDTGVIPFSYTVRIGVGTSDPTTNPDFVDLLVTGNITPKNYFLANNSGNGSSTIANQTLFVSGNTAVTNTPISLFFRSYDALDALGPNPDPFSSFAFTTNLNNQISSLTYTITAVPEPGNVAAVAGILVSGTLFTYRRKRRS